MIKIPLLHCTVSTRKWKKTKNNLEHQLERYTQNNNNGRKVACLVFTVSKVNIFIQEETEGSKKR